MSTQMEIRHRDFEKIYQQFIKQHGKELGDDYYRAWLKKLKLNDERPYGPQSQREAFVWAERTIKFYKKVEGAKLYKCEACFPLISMNDVIYTAEELKQATHNLVGKPVNMNHDGYPIDGVDIIGAEYEDDTAECLIKILDGTRCRKGSDVQQMIEDEEIVNVSVEADCELGLTKTPEGKRCDGLAFTGLGLLTTKVLPGIALTRIMPVERLVESFKGELGEEVNIAEPYPNEHACRVRDPADFQKGTFRRIKRDNLSMILGRLKGQTTMTLQAYRYPKDSWSVERARAHCKGHEGSFEPASEVLIPLEEGGITMVDEKENEKKEKDEAAVAVENTAKLNLEISELKREKRKLEQTVEVAEKQANDISVENDKLKREKEVVEAKLTQTVELHNKITEEYGDVVAEKTKLEKKLETVSEELAANVTLLEASQAGHAAEQKAHYKVATENARLTKDLTDRNNEVLDLQDTNAELVKKLKEVKRYSKIIVKI